MDVAPLGSAVGRQQSGEVDRRSTPAELEAQLYEHLSLMQTIEEELSIADGLKSAQQTVQKQQQAMVLLQQQERQQAEQAMAAQDAYFHGVVEHLQEQHVSQMRELEMGILTSREELAMNQQAFDQQLALREQVCWIAFWGELCCHLSDN